MAVKTASGPGNELQRIIDEIAQPDAKAIIYFFSPRLESIGVHTKIKHEFPQAVCIGASMIGGWSTGGAVEEGIVAMSLGPDEVEETYVAFGEGVKADPERAAQKAIAELKASFKGQQPFPDRYVGIILFDGLCLGERIIRAFTTERDFMVPFVGGAAADNLEFKRTLVSCDDRMSSDGLVALVLKMKVPFFYNHYVHYEPTQGSCVVTKADPERRVVWELDNRPAAERYAQLIGLSSPALLNHTHFSHNPLGVMIGDTVYTRSPNAIVDGKGLQFYCYLEAGTKVRLLKQGDIIKNAQEGLKEVRDYLPDLQGAILFNCVLRYLEMKEERKLDAFNGVFSGMQFIGFNTFGEELFTHHNQTLTALFIGGKK